MGLAMGPRHWVMSIYSIVKELITKGLITKDPWRGKRQARGRDEPRAQEVGARVYGNPVGVSPQAGYSGEARVPISIIQEGEKGIRGLMIVFMKMRAVTGFFGEMMTREKRRGSRYHCWNKVTGEIRVKAESRPNPAEKV